MDQTIRLILAHLLACPLVTVNCPFSHSYYHHRAMSSLVHPTLTNLCVWSLTSGQTDCPIGMSSVRLRLWQLLHFSLILDLSSLASPPGRNPPPSVSYLKARFLFCPFLLAPLSGRHLVCPINRYCTRHHFATSGQLGHLLAHYVTYILVLGKPCFTLNEPSCSQARGGNGSRVGLPLSHGQTDVSEWCHVLPLVLFTIALTD